MVRFRSTMSVRMSGRSNPLNHTTVVPSSDPEPGATREEEAIDALVVAWSASEAARLGEILFVPPSSAAILGRGEGAAEEPNARFFRQRPGALTPSPLLEAAALSRRQLAFQCERGQLTVTRLGRCPLLVNGHEVDSAELEPGDVVELRRELLLVCVRRAPRMPPTRHLMADWAGRFGAADRAGIVGESPAVWALRDALAFAAKAQLHVMLLGQSGTGKELAARSVHLMSAVAGPLVTRNAATLPAGLIDAELFGNARNYPQSGIAERPGLIGEADGGTLFLDEIGELPTDLQAHLLRVLDSDGEYQRLGEAWSRRSKFRLVAATNRPASALKHDFEARFGAQVIVPPLAERREDIPLIVARLLQAAAEKSPEVAAEFVSQDDDGRPVARVTSELIRHVLLEDWATNIRQLGAFLWRAIGASRGGELGLPEGVVTAHPAPRPVVPVEARPEPSAEEIRSALDAAAGKVPVAARALGLSSRFVLYRLMKKHGLARAED